MTTSRKEERYIRVEGRKIELDKNLRQLQRIKQQILDDLRQLQDLMKSDVRVSDEKRERWQENSARLEKLLQDIEAAISEVNLVKENSKKNNKTDARNKKQEEEAAAFIYRQKKNDYMDMHGYVNNYRYQSSWRYSFFRFVVNASIAVYRFVVNSYHETAFWIKTPVPKTNTEMRFQAERVRSDKEIATKKTDYKTENASHGNAVQKFFYNSIYLNVAAWIKFGADPEDALKSPTKADLQPLADKVINFRNAHGQLAYSVFSGIEAIDDHRKKIEKKSDSKKDLVQALVHKNSMLPVKTCAENLLQLFGVLIQSSAPEAVKELYGDHLGFLQKSLQKIQNLRDEITEHAMLKVPGRKKGKVKHSVEVYKEQIKAEIVNLKMLCEEAERFMVKNFFGLGTETARNGWKQMGKIIDADYQARLAVKQIKPASVPTPAARETKVAYHGTPAERKALLGNGVFRSDAVHLSSAPEKAVSRRAPEGGHVRGMESKRGGKLR